MNEVVIKESKYIKPAREQKVFHYVAVGFLFSLFVMPQYFGIPLPVFDLTLLRIMIIVVVFMIIADEKRKKDFMAIVTESQFSKVLVPYLLVIFYTMVLRVDFNAFLNPFIELFSFYLLIYLIKHELGMEKTIQFLMVFIYLLTFLGIIEYGIGRSPFSYLETIKGIYTGQFVRSGHYRIMGPCIHSLGYGLLLITITPFACLDLKKNQIDVFKRPVLLILLAANVFFTGSRSTLGIFVIEILLLFIFTDKQEKKKFIVCLLISIVLLVIFLVVFRGTGIANYIMLQITTVMDEILGTSYSVQYGANLSALGSSSNYRDQLKYIFTVDWLNPFLGIGRKRSFSAEINGSFIKSVDDFYAAEYIRYAYPGLIAFVIFIAYFVIHMLKDGIRQKSAVCKILFVGSICYLLNLHWIDSLQTLKYLYILFAIYWCLDLNIEVKKEESHGIEKNSKYLKKRG